MEKRKGTKEEKETNGGRIGDEGQPRKASSVKTGGVPEFNVAL